MQRIWLAQLESGLVMAMISNVAALAPAQIVVRQRRGAWVVRWADTERKFAEIVAALKGAVEMAYTSGKNGTPTCVVLLMGRSPKLVWSYGQDPFPPELRQYKSKSQQRASPSFGTRPRSAGRS